MNLDLHVHSSASDGTLTPLQLLKKADEAGFSHVSITDHDTVDGYDILTHDDISTILVPGIEISAEFSGGTLHILGYGIDPFEARLRRIIGELQRFRLERNRKIIANMERLGFDVSFEEVLNEAGGGIIGRPHFAALLLEKGYVATRQEAFDKFLGKGAPLYIDKQRLQSEEAISLIKGSGGIAVMAHPYKTNLKGKELRNLVGTLVSQGLAGIEAFYSRHSQEETKGCLGIAREFDLIVSAGSDFHGGNKAEIPLGMNVPENYLRPFFEAVGVRLPGASS